MTEEKKMQIAKYLSILCKKEEDTCVCPMAGEDECPFPETLCKDITTEDWKAWLEDD